MPYASQAPDRNTYPVGDSIRQSLNNLVNDFITFNRNRCLVDGGIATATVTSKAKIVNTTTYLAGGVYCSKGATDNFWTLSGTNVPTGQFCKFALLIDAAGAASIQQSSIAATLAACVFTALPTAKSVLAVLQITNASGADFVPGTTLLGAAGITATYVGNDDGMFLGFPVTP